MKVLVVAPLCPAPVDLGLKTHLAFVLETLAAEHTVEVVGFAATEAEERAWRQLAPAWGFRLRDVVRLRQGRGLAYERCRALLRGEPVGVAHYRGAAAEQAIAAGLAAGPDRVVYFLYPTVGPTVCTERSRAVLLPVDCYSLYYGRLAKTEPRWWARRKAGWLARCFARWERRYGEFGVVAPVGQVDALALRRLAPQARVEVLPVAAKPMRARERGPGLRVLVAGAFWMPAVEADTVRLLASWRRGPEELLVWGRGASSRLRAAIAAAGGSYVEWVEDYEGFLASGDIYVYPQRAAAGLQTKVQQAMSAGLAVVAVPEILEALGVDSDLAAVSAAPDGMAAAVRDLLEDHARREATGQAAREHIARHFAPEVVRGQLRRLLGEA
ncbi:MAG: glycosyltransferase [Burkholderiaceae bacterium]|nr:glycosyltransferase [Burkholderiaceae bacterium]